MRLIKSHKHHFVADLVRCCTLDKGLLIVNFYCEKQIEMSVLCGSVNLSGVRISVMSRIRIGSRGAPVALPLGDSSGLPYRPCNLLPPWDSQSLLICAFPKHILPSTEGGKSTCKNKTK